MATDDLRCFMCNHTIIAHPYTEFYPNRLFFRIDDNPFLGMYEEMCSPRCCDKFRKKMEKVEDVEEPKQHVDMWFSTRRSWCTIS